MDGLLEGGFCLNLSVLIGLAMYTLVGYGCGAGYEATKQKGDPGQTKWAKRFMIGVFVVLGVLATQFAKLWW